MAKAEYEVDIRTGRRDGDGLIRVSLFMDEMVALSLEGHGERAPTLLLTLEQARRLREALDELIPLGEQGGPQEKQATNAWDGQDRRRLAS